MGDRAKNEPPKLFPGIYVVRHARHGGVGLYFLLRQRHGLKISPPLDVLMRVIPFLSLGKTSSLIMWRVDGNSGTCRKTTSAWGHILQRQAAVAFTSKTRRTAAVRLHG